MSKLPSFVIQLQVFTIPSPQSTIPHCVSVAPTMESVPPPTLAASSNLRMRKSKSSLDYVSESAKVLTDAPKVPDIPDARRLQQPRKDSENFSIGIKQHSRELLSWRVAGQSVLAWCILVAAVLFISKRGTSIRHLDDAALVDGLHPETWTDRQRAIMSLQGPYAPGLPDPKQYKRHTALFDDAVLRQGGYELSQVVIASVASSQAFITVKTNECFVCDPMDRFRGTWLVIRPKSLAPRFLKL